MENLNFYLPSDLIARQPTETRGDSRLFVYDRGTQKTSHKNIRDLPSFLKSGDLLVFNNAKVDPVRVEWVDPKGKPQEILLLRPLDNQPSESRWEAIVSGKKLKPETNYDLPGQKKFSLLQRHEGGLAEISINDSVKGVRAWLHQVGRPPLPPYIRKERLRHGEPEDLATDFQRYQTLFAEKPGAVAAPTAGLHFSTELLEHVKSAGALIAYVHLNVGWGTFQPLTEAQWIAGRLHSESCDISSEVAAKILAAKKEKRRVIAVGTTVVRTLEEWHLRGSPENGFTGECDLFIRPPWKFGAVDALLTNFHLPASSLLALVAAFLGEQGQAKILRLYQEAIAQKYRFYSYGDCMWIV